MILQAILGFDIQRQKYERYWWRLSWKTPVSKHGSQAKMRSISGFGKKIDLFQELFPFSYSFQVATPFKCHLLSWYTEKQLSIVLRGFIL